LWKLSKFICHKKFLVTSNNFYLLTSLGLLWY
jgi:hypothetical protein